MLLSEIAGKEIVNLHDGAKLGLVGESDIKININGKVEALIISSRSGHSWFFSRNNDRDSDFIMIPWEAIRKIGTEVIIVDIDYAQFV
ncbi:MAG: YlmC/YmxH family sporulation protein [Gracilibacter sp. BRH_c7a]|nr:MAG: YlmC/YmxH family sporulation protein [Gracilibacter sp. BRH_c7a]